MKIRIGDGLVLVNLLVLAVVASILLFQTSILRIILGIPFLLFAPGYALLVAILPGRSRLDIIERIGLSFAASAAVVGLLGYILNFTPWGIRLASVLVAYALVVFVTSITGWLRGRQLPERERLNIEFKLAMPGQGKSVRSKALAVVLVATIVGIFGTLGYVVANPRAGERFSEFYVVGMNGKATDYPTTLEIGEEGKFIVGIVNHEGRAVDYGVEVIIGGVNSREVKVGVVGNEQKWEGTVSLVPAQAGDNQKVEFLLHKDGETGPTSALYFWVNVTE